MAKVSHEEILVPLNVILRMSLGWTIVCGRGTWTEIHEVEVSLTWRIVGAVIMHRHRTMTAVVVLLRDGSVDLPGIMMNGDHQL